MDTQKSLIHNLIYDTFKNECSFYEVSYVSGRMVISDTPVDFGHEIYIGEVDVRGDRIVHTSQNVIDSWTWKATMEFPSGEIDASEAIETFNSSRSVNCVYLQEEIPNNKIPITYTLTITSCKMSHPPRKSPENGSTFEFTIQLTSVTK